LYQDPALTILVLVVMIVSKSSFFLLLPVAFLAAAASLQSGGGRLGEVSRACRSEARVGVASLKYDVHAIRSEAEWARPALKTLWYDVRANVRTLEVDAVAEVRMAPRRLATVVKTN
jgi:hypothetical protein